MTAASWPVLDEGGTCIADSIIIATSTGSSLHVMQYKLCSYTSLQLHTAVSGARTKLNFLSISIRAIFDSSRANLRPIQLRGPQPNGM